MTVLLDRQCGRFWRERFRRDRLRVGSDERQQRGLERPLVQLDGVADLEAADHVEQRLQGASLGVEQ